MLPLYFRRCESRTSEQTMFVMRHVESRDGTGKSFEYPGHYMLAS